MAKAEFATLGGGCFWCIEAAFNKLKGVVSATSGYSGGEIDNPTYQQICSGSTGHAEVVQIEFDPDVISFQQLLTMFFQLHDPTQLNRQGNDIGTQYRSVIFYHNEEQKHQAEVLLCLLEQQNVWPEPIVTEIKPEHTFYPAEHYHQGYAESNPNQPYCQFLVLPKLEKFKEMFNDYLK